MAGKAHVVAGKPLAFALDSLSKNTLADMVAYVAIQELGSEATDEQLADKIQSWVNPVVAIRNDRPINIAQVMGRWHSAAKKHREKYGTEY